MAASNLKVMIIGAGLGGLTLGILLEQAEIPFVILEKRPEVSPQGSSISLSQAVQPFFEQLGMLPELNAMSKPIRSMTFLKESMSKIGSLDLYSNALRSYQADILVGADGAYSAVRRCLFQDLAEKNLLPKADLLPLSVDQECLVGVTDPIDPIYFPDLQQDTSDMMVVVGKDKPYSVGASDWSQERVDTMLGECRDFVCPYGGTLGDIFDQTPRSKISKVLLEEKFFETWHWDRVVLLGDACHKGAAQAILDAITLANRIYDIPSTSLKDIQAVFELYRKERAALGKAAVQGSRQMGRLSSGRKWSEAIIRTMFLNMVPAVVQQSISDKIFSIRPQATFLPQVEDRGTLKAKTQTPSTRMRQLTGPCLRPPSRNIS
ncbi:hypothetical protein BGZ94_002463 [Podila epigama]|nr:hypothetical protein BGZ94_002463 [Podila epigama]